MIFYLVNIRLWRIVNSMILLHKTICRLLCKLYTKVQKDVWKDDHQNFNSDFLRIVNVQ